MDSRRLSRSLLESDGLQDFNIPTEKHKLRILVHTEFIKGKLAGLLEGEGTITIRSSGSHKWYTPQVLFANTDMGIIEWIISSLKELNYRPISRFNKPISTKKGEKPLHEIRLSGQLQVYPFLRFIDDALVGRKKTLSRLVLEWCESRASYGTMVNKTPYSQRELEIIDKVREINGHRRN